MPHMLVWNYTLLKGVDVLTTILVAATLTVIAAAAIGYAICSLLAEQTSRRSAR